MPTEETYTLATGLTATFIETEPDSGGGVVLTATTKEAKRRLCRDARKDWNPPEDQYLPVLSDDPFELRYSAKESRDSRGGRNCWYAFPLSLDNEWFEPYKRELEKRTGFAGEVGDFPIELPDYRVLLLSGSLLRSIAGFRVEDCHLQATVIESGHGSYGDERLEKAHASAERCLKELVGHTPPVPEYVYNRNGTYSPNPKYATGFRNPVEARCVSEPVWGALWAWWRRTHANPAQEATLCAAESLVAKDSSLRESLFGLRDYSGLYVADPNGTCDWSQGRKARYVKWEEFRALAVPAPTA